MSFLAYKYTFVCSRFYLVFDLIYCVASTDSVTVRCSEWVSELFRGKVSSFEDKDFNYFLMESRPMLNKEDSKLFRVDLWAYLCFKHL